MAKNKYRFDVKDDGYTLPQSYEDEGKWADKQRQREKLPCMHVMVKAVLRVSRKHGKSNSRVSQNCASTRQSERSEYSTEDINYNLIMEDSIEFLSLEMLKGTRTEEDDLREAREQVGKAGC